MNLRSEKVGCDNLPCQCVDCGNYTLMCCFGKPICCPNDPNYDPSYRCPGFVEKRWLEKAVSNWTEEESENGSAD